MFPGRSPKLSTSGTLVQVTDLTAQGFWVMNSFKVTDTKPQNEELGRPVSAGLVGAGDGPVLTDDGVLVAVQLRLGHHEAGVVLGAAVFDAWRQ